MSYCLKLNERYKIVVFLARLHESILTSIISVCACLVQNACGGVVQLTATKLLGLRSSDGVISSLHAGKRTTIQ